MPANPPSHRLDALTTLRFFAALHVVLFHFGAVLFLALPAQLEAIRACGFTAVSFFFVLSGFILTFHYGEQLQRDALEPRRFWVQRVARIFPAYAFGLALMIPFALMTRWGDSASVFMGVSPFKKIASGAASLLMLQAWAPHTAASWNIPGWSISVEMFFYFAFPFVGPRVVRRLSQRALWGLAAGAYLVGLVPPLVYLATNPDHLATVTHESTGFWLTTLKFSPLVRFPEFVLGVAVGALFLRHRSSESRAGRSTLMAIVALLGIGGAMIEVRHIPYVLLHNGLFAPLYAMTIWGAAGAKSTLARALSGAPLRILGEASYSLYILQLPLMCYWLLAAHRWGFAGHSFSATAAYLAALLIIALASHYIIERSGQRVLKRAGLGLIGPRHFAASDIAQPGMAR